MFIQPDCNLYAISHPDRGRHPDFTLAGGGLRCRRHTGLAAASAGTAAGASPATAGTESVGPSAATRPAPRVKHLHPCHPHLDFRVTVEVWERDGRYMATADLGDDSRSVGVGDTLQEAVREPRRAVRERVAAEVKDDED